MKMPKYKVQECTNCHADIHATKLNWIGKLTWLVFCLAIPFIAIPLLLFSLAYDANQMDAKKCNSCNQETLKPVEHVRV